MKKRYLEVYLLKVLSFLILSFVLLPLLAIVYLSFAGQDFFVYKSGISFKWYLEAFESREWRQATIYTLQNSLLATLITSVIYIPSGISIGLKEDAGWMVSILIIPFIIPILVLALGLYNWLGPLRNSIFALPIAHAIYTSPIVVLVLRNAAQTISDEEINAAQVHGASRIDTLFDVAIPQIYGPIVSSCLITFLISFTEPILPLYLTTPGNETLPVKIWSSLRFTVSPITAAIGTLSMVVSGLLLYLILKLIGQRYQNV